MHPAPCFPRKDESSAKDPVNRGSTLVNTMLEYGLRTVLCAGSGISQEPRALAEAGFDVTALDVSPTALAVAQAYRLGDEGFRFFCGFVSRQVGRPARFEVGDLLDSDICPGPFDVVIERCTVQRFPEETRASALDALAKRLGRVGILLSQCLDDQFDPDLGWKQHPTGLFHASEPWCRDRGWTIWDGVPESTLTGQVAWLERCGSMKARPRERS
jgi:hypothetical protein